MRAASSQHGYALLAALVVTALAAVFAAAAVAAVTARQNIVGADVAKARAQTAAREALSCVCVELRRHPAALDGELASPVVPTHDATWHASWVAVSAGAGTEWPATTVAVEGSSGDARQRLSAVLQLRAEPVPQGLVAAGDMDLQAPLRVTGSGIYCGGCVRGREWVEFGSLEAADGVHGDVWPQAGVHALGGVWSAGKEIHNGPEAGAQYVRDTDTHTAGNDVARLVTAPDASLLISLRDASVAPGEALQDGVLDLARLPLTRPLSAGVGRRDDGYVVVATAAEGAELRIVGMRPAGACPVVLVVQGSAALGEPGTSTAFAGALLVLGSLRVSGASVVAGHLLASDVLVSAPLTLELADDWRLRPLTGLVSPLLLSLDGR